MDVKATGEGAGYRRSGELINKAVRETEIPGNASHTRPRSVLPEIVVLVTAKDVEVTTGVKLSTLLGQGGSNSHQSK